MKKQVSFSKNEMPAFICVTLVMCPFEYTGKNWVGFMNSKTLVESQEETFIMVRKRLAFCPWYTSVGAGSSKGFVTWSGQV